MSLKDRITARIRFCTKCGREHDTYIEETANGDRVKQLDICKDCLLMGCYVKPITEQIVIDPFRFMFAPTFVLQRAMEQTEAELRGSLSK